MDGGVDGLKRMDRMPPELRFGSFDSYGMLRVSAASPRSQLGTECDEWHRREEVQGGALVGESLGTNRKDEFKGDLMEI